MKTIKLMPDYRCHPLWNISPGDYENISPESLPISQALQQALVAWADQYDLTLDLDNPCDAGFDSRHSADLFVAMGHTLLSRLQDELGVNYIVLHNISAYPKLSTS